MKKPTPITIVVDTREQTPLIFTPDVTVEKTALAVGDYSIKGLEHLVTLERKTRSDYLGCFWKPDFKERLFKMTGFKRPYLLIECLYEELFLPTPFSSVHPNQVKGAIASILGRLGIPVIFLRNRTQAAEFVADLFRKIQEELASASTASNLGLEAKHKKVAK